MFMAMLMVVVVSLIAFVTRLDILKVLEPYLAHGFEHPARVLDHYRLDPLLI